MFSEVNKDIKRTAQYHGVKQWEIARYLGIGETTLQRWLRDENMPVERKAKLFNAIDILGARK